MNRSAVGGKGTGANRTGGRPRAGRAALAVGFAFGAAFGLALGAVAYFMSLESAPSGVLAYGMRLTGHADMPEDLIWFFSGGFIGAMMAAYAAWRADRRRTDGIGKEHVFNRTLRVIEGDPAAGAREMPSSDETSRRGERS